MNYDKYIGEKFLCKHDVYIYNSKEGLKKGKIYKLIVVEYLLTNIILFFENNVQIPLSYNIGTIFDYFYTPDEILKMKIDKIRKR